MDTSNRGTGPTSRRRRLPAVVLAVAGLTVAGVGVGVSSPASAGTDNFGQAVYRCAREMLPYTLDAGGGITMTMPDGSTMHWRSFGEMVTSMRSLDMCF